MYVCMYVCMCVFMYVCMCVCLYVCVFLCMYVCVFLCMYVCVSSCMYVCRAPSMAVCRPPSTLHPFSQAAHTDRLHIDVHLHSTRIGVLKNTYEGALKQRNPKPATLRTHSILTEHILF